jgi:hypothetical protein
MYVWWGVRGEVKKKGRGLCGWWGKKRKEKREKEMKRWCTWVVEKKRKEKKKFNKVMIKTKSKN